VPVLCARPEIGENFRDHFATRLKWRIARKVTFNERLSGPALLREGLRYALGRRGVLSMPIAIGFGVRTPEQAAAAVRVADAAVVASALIETLAASLDDEGRATETTVEQVLAQVRALAEGVRSARLAHA
jgi:hypothetical protein